MGLRRKYGWGLEVVVWGLKVVGAGEGGLGVLRALGWCGEGLVLVGDLEGVRVVKWEI